MATVHDFEANLLDGAPQKMDAYRGKVLLIVNVVSKCGFTPQYASREDMYQTHQDQGSRCWASRATSSGIRNRATRTRSADSARRSTP